MILKQRLFSNMFLRNMLADFGNRSAYSKIPGTFIPYFQYRIGPYQPDHYLYFPKEPYTLRYQNEIFNKLYEYKGYDIITYLDFHFSACSDKRDFLRFLQYEISDRLKQKPNETRRQKLQPAQEWVTEQQQELQRSQQAALQLEIEQGVNEILFQKQGEHNQNGMEAAAQTLVQKIGSHVEQIMANTEERMEALTNSYVTGKIELNNHSHYEKLMQLFILILEIQAPAQKGSVELLFRKISITDIAAILHLHFPHFRKTKFNTVQTNIGAAGERLNRKSPQVRKLTEAFQEFMYQ